MLLIIFHFLATFQAVSPLRPGELDELRRLLTATEAWPAAESGEFGVDSAETTPADRKPMAYTGRYAIDGEKMVVVTRGFDEEASRVRAFVRCRNDRHQFELEHLRGGWAITQFGAGFGDVSNNLRTFFVFLFGGMYAIQRENVSDLLANPDYRVTALRLGPRDFYVHGTRSDQVPVGTQERVREFRCAIRVPPSRNYAYVVAATSTGVSERGDRREETINEVSEDPDRPRLVRSANDRVVTVDGATYRYNAKVTFRIQAGVPEGEKGAFELTHYGLSEPPSLTSVELPGPGPSQSTDWTPYHLAFAGIVGLAAVVVGRGLTTTRRATKPDHQPDGRQ